VNTYAEKNPGSLTENRRAEAKRANNKRQYPDDKNKDGENKESNEDKCQNKLRELADEFQFKN